MTTSRAADPHASDADCIFCRIVRDELPSRRVFEDDDMIAFHDIRPIAPVHFLIIPRLHVVSLGHCSDAHAPLLGRMLAKAGTLAREQGLGDGFRTIINTGRGGGQEVYHLHIHIVGGPRPLGAMLPREV
jgi:histidine triad (HIT) family protein